MEITLALGGGGARGAAHLGVLRVLEREGFQVRAVAGTSIGSIVAALYAWQPTAASVAQIFQNIDQAKLYGWSALRDGPALLGTRGIQDFLRQYLDQKTFQDLRLPCAAVAVDLKSNREIILQEGSVIEAILGSIAIPGIFPPREHAPYLLVDGGVLDPVPVRAARALAPHLPVVAVSLMPPLDSPSTPIAIPSSLPKPLAEQIKRLHITQAVKIFADSIDIGQRQMTELRLLQDRPEVIIRPDVADINILDRVDVNHIALRGEVAAQQALPALRRAVSWQARALRTLQHGRKP